MWVSDVDELRNVLEGLVQENPTPLLVWSIPDDARRGEVRLAPWAEEVAADLHARFADRLDVTLGFFSYPDRGLPNWEWRDMREGLAIVDPAWLEVVLDGPLTVVSGHTANHRLVISNRGESEIAIATNGRLTGFVVDPDSGSLVGVSVEPQPMPLVRFKAAAGATVTIPFLVGTASVVPELGYAVPAGTWVAQAILTLDVNRELLTPELPFTVVAPNDI
jgi:hypothetical protein